MHNLIKYVLTCCLALLVIFGFSKLQINDTLERATIDLREMNLAPKTGASNRIILVLIDDETIKKLNNGPKISRNFLATLNNRLSRAKPAAIGYDIYFRDPSYANVDKALARSFWQSPAYSIGILRNSGIKPPIKLFEKSLKGIGIANFPAGMVGTRVSTANLYYETRSKTETFAALLYRAATGNDASAVVGSTWHWPTLGLIKFSPYFEKNDSILIRYISTQDNQEQEKDTFKAFSAYLVANGSVPLSNFKNKIVLVGKTHEGSVNTYLIPFSEKFADFSQMNSTMIYANILNQLLTGQFYYGLKNVQKWFYVLLIVLVVSALVIFLTPFRASIFFVFIILGIIISALYAFHSAGIVLPIILPVVAAVSAFYIGILVNSLARKIYMRKRADDVNEEI